MPESHAAIQRDLEKWADRDLIKCSKGKYIVVQLGRKKKTAGEYPSEKHLCRKELGSAGRYQVKHEPAMCPSSKEGWWYSRLHEECCQQINC